MDSSSIAGSALQAFSTGQQVAAHNIANLNTENATASRVTFQETGNGGVSANVANTNDTVDISREAVSLVANVQGYKANLKVLKASDEMTRELLNIKA